MAKLDRKRSRRTKRKKIRIKLKLTDKLLILNILATLSLHLKREELIMLIEYTKNLIGV